jgi:hypothetical protein
VWIGDRDNLVVVDLEGPLQRAPEGRLIIYDENLSRFQEATFRVVR